MGRSEKHKIMDVPIISPLFPMEKGDNDELFGLLQFDTKSYKIYTDLIFRNMVKKLDKI
jgi:hypothetical protein